jgi:phytoene desaturase
MKKKVIIVGAGPGGLSSAMVLAHAGYDVTVVERAAKVGGRTSSIQADGFTFDAGPTFFLYPRVLEEIFSSVGRNLRDEVNLIRLDPQYRIIFGAGGELLATGDIERMEKQIAAISPDDAPAFRRFMDDNRIKLERFRPCLESSYLSWRDVATVRMMKLMPLLRPHLSLDSELGRYFKEPRIRLAFSFQSKYLGMSPFRCPSLFSILSFIEYEYGIFHPEGGCSSISTAMARVATDLGAKILLNHEVTEVLFEGRRAVGIRAGGEEIRADAVVINADFARAMTRLIPAKLRRRWSDAKIAQKKFSCSTFMMYLGLEGRQDELAHHNIFISKDYLQNMEDIESGHVLSKDPSFYVANPSRTDPTMAPAGMSSMYILVPVTHTHPNVDWKKMKEPFRKSVLAQLGKIGLNDVEKRIRFERICTPDDWENGFEIYRGATFNLAHNLGQMLHLRPRNRFEELDNVYLVGGGTHPGSGLPVIFESARITSRLLQEDIAV